MLSNWIWTNSWMQIKLKNTGHLKGILTKWWSNNQLDKSNSCKSNWMCREINYQPLTYGKRRSEIKMMSSRSLCEEYPRRTSIEWTQRMRSRIRTSIILILPYTQGSNSKIRRTCSLSRRIPLAKMERMGCKKSMKIMLVTPSSKIWCSTLADMSQLRTYRTLSTAGKWS